MSLAETMDRPFNVEAFLAGQQVVQDETFDPKDELLNVQFMTEVVVDEMQTRLQNRPVYVEREMILVAAPGSRDEVYDILADDYRRRFSKRYQAWKANKEAPINGTPLSQWPAISAIHVKELEAMRVRSVEQLADAEITFLQRLGPVYVDYGAKAKGFIASMSTDIGAVEKATRDAAQAMADNDALRQQLAAMQAMLEDLTKPEAEAKKAKA